MLKLVAESLGDLLGEVVFVGGATTELYVDGSAAPTPRPTEDVDCIIEIASYLAYTDLESKLRARGFANDQTDHTQICRWIISGTIVDVMPISENILGFTNEWYATAMENAVPFTIDAIRIRILNVPYFFATKLSALRSRGMRDLRTSKDFEDLVYVLNNRADVLRDIMSGTPEVLSYIRRGFSELLALSIFDEAISAVLDYGEPSGTQVKIANLIKEVTSSK